jgi:hypothetical protein
MESPLQSVDLSPELIGLVLSGLAISVIFSDSIPGLRLDPTFYEEKICTFVSNY